MRVRSLPVAAAALVAASLITPVSAPAAAAAQAAVTDVSAAPASSAASRASAAKADDGELEDFTLADPRITESSGLAASRQHPGIFWTHNDSDDGPYLYAVDSATGRTVATLTLKGIGSPRDVEAISVGPGNKLWVGDIGDNQGGTWPYVWIYELPEPKELGDRTVTATQYTVTYEDGPRDAEALMVHPKTGRVWIADKKEDGGSLYEGPAQLSTGGKNVFRRVAAVSDLVVTDGAFSPDGEWLALRSYFGGVSYSWNDGKPRRKGRLDVPLTGQGESMTYSADGTALLYGAEGEQSPVVVRHLKGGGGEGAKPSQDGSTGDSAGDEGPEFEADWSVGALVLAGGFVLLFVIRGFFRRRG